LKKAFSVFATIIILIAAGCEKQKSVQSSPPPVPSAFTSNLEVTYGETAMTAELTQKSAEEFNIQILTPEILSPLALTYNKGTCTVTYDGLKFETDLNRFPQASFGTLLTQTVSDIAQGIDIETTYSDGIWTYKGTGEHGIFVMTRDGETGAWLELSIEGAPLHVVFSNFAQN